MKVRMLLAQEKRWESRCRGRKAYENRKRMKVRMLLAQEMRGEGR